MFDRKTYINNKHSQINRWIAELARLDALCRENGETARVRFEAQLKDFSQTLKELQLLLAAFEDLDEKSKEKFITLIESKWPELESSFNQSVSDFERISRGTP